MNHWGELNHDFQIKISQQRLTDFAHFFDKFSFEKRRFQTKNNRKKVQHWKVAFYHQVFTLKVRKNSSVAIL